MPRATLTGTAPFCNSRLPTSLPCTHYGFIGSSVPVDNQQLLSLFLGKVHAAFPIENQHVRVQKLEGAYGHSTGRFPTTGLAA